MESNLNDLIDKTFNELTIEKFIDKPDTDKYKSWNTNIWVHCKCSCGEEIDAPLYGIRNGYIKSCGCVRRQKAAENLEETKKTNPTPTAIYITHQGKTLNISEWSQLTGIPRSTIAYRLSKNLPTDKILERRDDNG